MTTKEKRQEIYQKNKEYIKQKAKEWSLNNPERRKETSKKYRENHMPQYLFRAAETRAKQKGLDFTIELADIVIPEICPYLKVKLNKELGKGRNNMARRYSPSLDRIDNTKGYIKGNIEVISWLANTMKSSANQDELLRFAISILETRYE